MSDGGSSGKYRSRLSRHWLPSLGELELWRAALADVEPLPGRERPIHRPPPEPPRKLHERRLSPISGPMPAPPRPLPDLALGSPAGLDRSTAERLKRGRYPIEARLDLHGMTQEQAHDSVTSFLNRAEFNGYRCVLVITGKGFRRVGEAEGGTREIGILKSAVPRWLNEAPNRARILAITEAQPKDGGGGAFYILLRRKR
jgi:DNA-nicking Smr family endonuclease